MRNKNWMLATWGAALSDMACLTGITGRESPLQLRVKWLRRALAGALFTVLALGAAMPAAADLPATAPPVMADTATPGDGYRPILYKDKTYLIFHNWNGDALYCNVQATGHACPGFPTTVPSAAGAAFAPAANPWYVSADDPQEYLDRSTGRLYFYADTGAGPAVICADLNTQQSCGSYQFSAVNGRVAGAGFYANRYYAATHGDRMQCLDLTSFAPCEGAGADGAFTVSGAGPSGYRSAPALQMDSRMYWVGGFKSEVQHLPPE